MGEDAEGLRFAVGEDAQREEIAALLAARLRPSAAGAEGGIAEDDERSPSTSEADPRARIAVHGTFEGVRFVVALERTPLQRGGTRPFTEVVLEEDLGATIELRGAHGLHLATDAPTAFRSAALADVVLVGAPTALVREVAELLEERFAALLRAGAEVITFEVGPYAERAGGKRRGVRLVCRGWPLDAAALDHLLRIAVVVRENVLAKGPKLARHAEVIAHERALSFGAATAPAARRTKRIALVGFAFFAAALVLALLLMLGRG